MSGVRSQTRGSAMRGAERGKGPPRATSRVWGGAPPEDEWDVSLHDGAVYRCRASGVRRAGARCEERSGARGPRERRAGVWGGAPPEDEWDVSLHDGAVYRIFRDRVSEGWFIDAIVD